MPLANLNVKEGNMYSFYVHEITKNGAESGILSVNYTGIIIVGLMLLNAVICFLIYKKRILQIRLTTINIFMMIGSIILLWYNISSFAKDNDAQIFYNIPMVIPIITIILSYLAIRAIGKDEALIRSIDRIR
jgi:hypothetical protein